MPSKTPLFDESLSEYYTNLNLKPETGIWRTCRFSGEKFYIRPEDVEFYKRIGVPLPTLSPAERLRRRMNYQNDYNLFVIKSAYSGKPIVATYPPNTPYKVYEHTHWFGDGWNPTDHGREYEEGGFFDQFVALQHDVPRPNLVSDSTNVNSEYTNTSTGLRDSYLVFDSLGGEYLYYFACCVNNRHCVDCMDLYKCSECYRCKGVFESYSCFFVKEARRCINSYFLYDCRDCENCFMCSNLRNRKYYFENQPLSQKEYEAKIKEINLGDWNVLSEYAEKWEAMSKKAIRKNHSNNQAINCVGESIEHSKNCYWGYFVYESENVNYSTGLLGYKDSYEVFGGAGGELCYEFISVSTKNNFNIKCSSQLDNCRDCEYCDLCRNCNNCFGCIGLANKSFCILNKQYSENDYWDHVDQIKTEMLGNGEYGEFFPPHAMPVPYKISFATSYPGFRDYENAEKYGYDTEEVEAPVAGKREDVIKANNLPIDIKDVDDSILEKIIHDEKNNKHFRVMKYELDFYRKHNFALPREHPLVRLANFREEYDLRLKFFNRKCPACGTNMQSPLEPEKYANVLCETCYLTRIG